MNENQPMPAELARGGDWLSRYGARQGFDEMIGADGMVRKHWRPIVSFLQSVGMERASAMSERIQRRIQVYFRLQNQRTANQKDCQPAGLTQNMKHGCIS